MLKISHITWGIRILNFLIYYLKFKFSWYLILSGNRMFKGLESGL